MSQYIKPLELVWQEFGQVPSAATGPMRAHILGPHAGLHRYSVKAEKTKIKLGEYDPSGDTEYDWPNRQSNSSVIDTDYVKVFIDDALLRYYTDQIGQGGTIKPVSGYPTRVRSSVTAFKDNGDDFPRSSTLYDRDVKVGDVAIVRGIGTDSEEYTLTSYVKDFVAEVVAASVGTVEASAENADTQGSAVSIDKTGGVDNCIMIEADISDYDGREDGDIEETYTIEVTQSSVDGDLTTARLRIRSASGNDDVATVTPSAQGNPTDVGTRGLTVVFSNTSLASCGSAANDDDASPDDLVVGQKWKVHVFQAFTATTATSGGTYTGADDTTYIVTVTKGGLYSASPEISVSTTTGVDASGPTAVTGAGNAVSIGSKGVTINFGSEMNGLRKGDKFEIEVTAESEGALQTLVLAHSLPTKIRTASDLSLKLYMKKNIEVPENRKGFAPTVNWTVDQETITLNDGLKVYDAEWTDDDEELPLDVDGGTLYAQYREWLITYIAKSGSATLSTLETKLGTNHPDNPVCWGVFKALLASNDVPVNFTAVADPEDEDEWKAALEVVAGMPDNYTLVPLTQDEDILELVKKHVVDQSAASDLLRRRALFSLAVQETKELVGENTSDDDEVVLATLSDDPDTSGTQYTLLTITSGNAELTDAGVSEGDQVRFIFTDDGFGNDEYETFTVEEVKGEDTLLLSSGHTGAISTAQKVEIWSTPTKTAMANELAGRIEDYDSSRISVVFPDTVGGNGVTMPGYFLCAALAGLRSGVAPHQSLTDVELPGFDDLTRSTEFFHPTQLDILADVGGWVVTADSEGTVFSRQALTTDLTEVATANEMSVANIDSVVIQIKNDLSRYEGPANLVDSTLLAMRSQLQATIERLKSAGSTPTLGGQLISGDILQLRAHSTAKDRVLVGLSLTFPAPINAIELVLVV